MSLVQNFPFFTIILSMFAGIISFPLPAKAARAVHLFMVSAVLVLSTAVYAFTVREGFSYTFMMGHFPAPWGNEIRVGELETLMAAFFALIMLLSVLGGLTAISRDVQKSKQNLFYILLDFLMSSLLTLIYTNDLFTAYVFIEINTITACGIIMIRKSGQNYVSAVQYMIMSLVGSGLFLIGLSLLYSITGHLLMSPAKESLHAVFRNGTYVLPLEMTLILMTIGLGIKCGLYPFHNWIPDAYSYTTPAASSILSSLVSKGYIFLLIKLFYRVLEFSSLVRTRMVDVLFVFGVLGMIMGSIAAIQENNIRRMTAYSSVAQIGYIFMGIGLGTEAGVSASIFHIFSHASTKALLFISIAGLVDVSQGRLDFAGLRGSGFRHRLAGAAFTVGALSMVGLPLLTGFVSKYLFAAAATTTPIRVKMLAAWIALAISTILNAVYFMRMVLIIYTPLNMPRNAPEGYRQSPVENLGMVGLILINFILGIASPPVIESIGRGLSLFG